MAGYEWRPGGTPAFTFETQEDLDRFVRERVFGDYVFTSAEVRDAWLKAHEGPPRRPLKSSGRPGVPLPPGSFFKPVTVVKSTNAGKFMPQINT